ncbi:hypothetical protein OEZ85_005189 [Tetradesmus obliquus]|uniref:Lipase n=1 Tax=Tetradesmus obliquus TaxID=3088 RepID=A0ABY8UMK3_TETOB|nr:hypothetical protein OEZ85_005189 [Tetradesmus obliquus]
MEDMVPEGYPIEKHRVNTEDGWVLNMYRIPHGKYRNNKPGPRPVVLLHHGITLSSACWTLLNANESTAYILADAGFDVWMANTRSNTFSRGNYKHSYRDQEYWYHSMDEYALIDLPAQINTALAKTGAPKLAVVGHSQGCSLVYAMLSVMPEMNDKVSVVAHLGAVVFLDFFRAPVLKAFAEVRNDKFFYNSWLGEFLWYRFLAPYVKTCTEYIWSELCMSTLNIMFYGPSAFISPDDNPVIFQTWPASVSGRNMAHWAQMLTDGQLRFQRFDHGTNCSHRNRPYDETCNQQRYGSLQPPEYDLSQITAPQYLFAAEMDVMATNEDAAEQKRRLRPEAFAGETIYQNYAHMDFVWDRNARHAVDLVDLLYRYAPQ